MLDVIAIDGHKTLLWCTNERRDNVVDHHYDSIEDIHGHTCTDVVIIMDDRVMNQNYEHIGLKAIDSCLHRVCGPVVW